MANKLTENTEGSVENMYKALTTVMHEAAFEALGEKETRTTPSQAYWWTAGMVELVEKKETLRQWLVTKDQDDHKQYA